MESHYRGKGDRLRETGHLEARNVELSARPCAARLRRPHDRQPRSTRPSLTAVAAIVRQPCLRRVRTTGRARRFIRSCLPLQPHRVRCGFVRLSPAPFVPAPLPRHDDTNDHQQQPHPTRPGSSAPRRRRQGRNDPCDQSIVRVPTHLDRATRPGTHRPKRALLNRPTRTVRRRAHRRESPVALRTLAALSLRD